MFNFDSMITPTIIKIVYGIFASIGVLLGLSVLIKGLGRFGSGFQVILGLIIIVLAPFTTRIICEGMIVIFKINENLQRIIDEKVEN